MPEPVFSSPTAVRTAEKMSDDLAREYLEGIAARIQGQHIEVQVTTVEGKPYGEIIRFAETQQIDLVILSTRGHSGWSRWLLGSVADRVVRGATVPVLLVQCQE